MADPVYPATLLAVGRQDPEFGGQPADDFGGPAWAYHDACIQELQKQSIWTAWTPYTQRKMRIGAAGLPGDVLFLYLDGASTYTLLTAAGLAALAVSYDPDLTPRVGILAEACSAAADALVILWGHGIAPEIHGLSAGASGDVVMNVTSGRLERSTGTAGEKKVGKITARGYVSLDMKSPTSE